MSVWIVLVFKSILLKIQKIQISIRSTQVSKFLAWNFKKGCGVIIVNAGDPNFCRLALFLIITERSANFVFVDYVTLKYATFLNWWNISVTEISAII